MNKNLECYFYLQLASLYIVFIIIIISALIQISNLKSFTKKETFLIFNIQLQKNFNIFIARM